ncbi:hypothetical protein FRC07_012901 [Ceratobasidium sp. 392]|nr:hypothetical protein FRC07_012901 [Ceratobasidium sp. 392]
MSIATLSSLPRPVAADKCITKSRLSSDPTGTVGLPNLIAVSSTMTSLDVPRVTAVTVQAHKPSAHILPGLCAPKQSETSVYRTLDSTTRFAIIVPLSASKATYEASIEPNTDVIVLGAPPRPKRSVTIQRLGVQTSLPAWAIDYTLTRSGGRFSLMSRAELRRPASERLAVQEMESEDRIAVTTGLEPTYQGLHTKRTRDNKFASEEFTTFKRLVSERTRPRHLELMGPLRLAVHNNLTRSIAILNNSGRPIKGTPSSKDSKSMSSHRMRRMTPTLASLNTEVARACMVVDPETGSPLESPELVTPVDETTIKERCTTKDKSTVPIKSPKKGVAHRVRSKGRSKARMSHRF